jgi:alkylation response protein AidB-like acyl-CoA dehydrogenase
MTAYFAPIRDMQFVINELADLSEGCRSPHLRRAGGWPGAGWKPSWRKPPNWPPRCWRRSTSRATCRVFGSIPEGVVPAAGFTEAYRSFIEGGWNGIGSPVAHGGQGLPELFNTATQEMWNSANMSFALCPMLNAGAIEAISRAGSAEQRRCTCRTWSAANGPAP